MNLMTMTVSVNEAPGSLSRSWDTESICLQCLFQTGGHAVTRVKLKESIDDTIAVGSSSGDVCIFQLPSAMTGMPQQVNSTFLWIILHRK